MNNNKECDFQCDDTQKEILKFLYEHYYKKNNNYIPCVWLQGRCFLISCEGKHDELDVEKLCVKDLFDNGLLKQHTKETVALTDVGTRYAESLFEAKKD